MPSLDQILNIVIPIGIFFFLFALFYSKFKPAFDTMFKWILEGIRRLSSGSKAKVQEYTTEIVYR